jgi:hypothetical protein
MAINNEYVELALNCIIWKLFLITTHKIEEFLQLFEGYLRHRRA